MHFLENYWIVPSFFSHVIVTIFIFFSPLIGLVNVPLELSMVVVVASPSVSEALVEPPYFPVNHYYLD